MALWRLPCKSWNCPSCAKKKARQLGNRARDNFKGHHLRFWTLTVKPTQNIERAILDANKAWNRLRLKITRKFGKVKYFKVLEAQSATNMPHFHILLDKFIPWAWMRGAALSSGFGCHLWVEDVRDEHIYGYVLKYLRKGINNDIFSEALLGVNGRRVSFSRTVLITNFKSNFTPMYMVNSFYNNATAIFLHLMWYKISISSGYYPLPGDNNHCMYFFPNPDIKLLPPPTGAALDRIAASSDGKLVTFNNGGTSIVKTVEPVTKV